LVIYGFFIFSLLSITNFYIVWFLIEIIFLFFLLIVIGYEIKRIGLIIYFFFQSLVSLFLFIRIIFSFEKLIFILLSAKLGLFPFFYWMVVVRVKVGFIGNIFVLSLQKVSVFWLIWLLISVPLSFVYILVYLRIFFVVIRLVLISDLWLLLVYSSIANTGIIILRVYGSYYLYIVLLYLFIILGIIYFVKNSESYEEIMLIVFFFLVIPPFILFFMKFYVVFRLDFILKLRFLFVIFDVLVLLYYFRLVFMKFLLIEVGILVYLLNLLLVLIVVIFRN